MLKVTKGLAPHFFLSVFNTRNKVNYNFRQASHFYVSLVNSANNETESLSSKIWAYTTHWRKEDKNSESIQRCHKNENQKNNHVHFASVNWLESEFQYGKFKNINYFFQSRFFCNKREEKSSLNLDSVTLFFLSQFRGL